jgi:energy-converting hydrogenase A subunit R
MARHFTTDCEGPISKNDNAQELSAYFIPKGETFFALVSKYDDFLADVLRKPGYKAGDTLKLILPFLIAFGASNAAVRDYSRSHILLVPGAIETLRFVRQRMASFIISTSYGPYIHALCDLIDFPVNHVFFTHVDIDRYQMDPEEGSLLRKIATEIIQMEVPQWGDDVKEIDDLPKDHQKAIRHLNQIFWNTLPHMKIGRIFEEVNPVGGVEKAKALLKSLEGTGGGLEDVMYVGDSITDVQALELVREHGGLAVSFNGNGYAIRSAHVCAMSGDARAVAVLADVFSKEGRAGTLHLVKSWSVRDTGGFSFDDTLQRWLDTLSESTFPEIELITDANRKSLTLASEAFRKSVRGEQIGGLG